MSEMPTGYIEVPEPLAFDTQALQAIQTMMGGYDGAVPFPDYVEQYMQAWEKCLQENPEDEQNPPYFDLRSLQYIVFPPNDPRRQKHDGILPGRNTYQVKHMFGLSRPKVASVRIGHEEPTSDEVWLSPKQALSLLDWLRQERETLQKLACIQEQEHAR